MIDLSIIIPHYNSPRLLESLLLSIPKKKEIQIIVVDDKSNKNVGTLEQLKNDKRFHHVQFLNNYTKNKGAGVCRNIGVNKAKGRWVLFADSDDFFVDNFYNKVSIYFDSDYDVIFYKPTSIDLNNRLKSDRHEVYAQLIDDYLNNVNYESEIRLRYLFFVPWSKLIRRKLLVDNDISFDDVIASNDVMFSTKLGYFMQKFKVDSNVIYCVTRSKGTLTTTITAQSYDARLNTYVRYCNFIRSHLKKVDVNLIPINGLRQLIDAFRYKLGFKKAISTFVTLKRNKIPLLDKRFINPVFVLSKFKSKVQK